MEFNRYYKEVKDRFIKSSVNLSAIIVSCEKVVNNISQERIDELAAAVEAFDIDYAAMKAAMNKLIVESFEDKIDATKTEDGFEL